MGVRAFVSIPDVQNSRLRPILGQFDLTRRDQHALTNQARFKPEEHLPWATIAPLPGRFRWMWRTGKNPEPARIRAPIYAVVGSRRAKRDRLLSKGLGSSNHENFFGPIGAYGFPCSFLRLATPAARRKFQRRPKSGPPDRCKSYASVTVHLTVIKQKKAVGQQSMTKRVCPVRRRESVHQSLDKNRIEERPH